MERFTGTVEALCDIDVTDMQQWIRAIPFTDWPQQGTDDGSIKPSMVTDLEWHGFGFLAAPIVGRLLRQFSRTDRAYQRMLSVVMPGNSIPPHKDGQASYWITRVHVPLSMDEFCSFNVDGVSYWMVPGMAYMVNTMKIHSVQNAGTEPRTHFMFDVRSAA